MYFWF